MRFLSERARANLPRSCSVNIGELRDGHRHDMWQTLRDVKMGRLHLAITVLEDAAAGAASGKVIHVTLFTVVAAVRGRGRTRVD